MCQAALAFSCRLKPARLLAEELVLGSASSKGVDLLICYHAALRGVKHSSTGEPVVISQGGFWPRLREMEGQGRGTETEASAPWWLEVLRGLGLCQK